MQKQAHHFTKVDGSAGIAARVTSDAVFNHPAYMLAQKMQAARIASGKSRYSDNVLSPAASNSKQRKQLQKLGLEAMIFYGAPADMAGYQSCIFATIGCKSACLFTAGLGKMLNVQARRILKTWWLFEQHEAFMARLSKQLVLLTKRAQKKGLVPVVRLNGTTDIDWLTMPIRRDGIVFENPFVAFPEVTFYDYTKRAPIIRQYRAGLLPSNYHVTFSLSEGNDRHALEALAAGLNVAAVVRADDEMPASFAGRDTIDGDAHDYRFLDGNLGRFVILKAKGEAKQDTTGFVRDIAAGLEPERKLSLAVQG